MYKLPLRLSVLIFVAACNTTTTDNSEIKKDSFDTSSTPMTIQVPNTRCFSSIKGRDTVYLKLEKFPNVVTGNLSYKLYEKDSNTGTIDGKMNGDTLIADYTFMSEGQQSIRQVAFLIKDSVVTEGYADVEDKDGKMVFKNTGALDFSKGIQLKEIACPLE